MTQKDHDQLIICKRVIESSLSNANNARRSADLRETLAQINTKLLDPIEPEHYSGEFKTVDNPFL
jgi:hypothetical protein